MRFPAVVNDEDHRLRNRREQHNDSVYERLLKLCIGANIFIFFEYIFEPDLVESIIVYSQENDDLPKE